MRRHVKHGIMPLAKANIYTERMHMNFIYFLIPKEQVAVIYDDCSLRQGLEKLHNRGYSAIPVLSRDDRYIGTVSEGDFLWYIVDAQGEAEMEHVPLQNLEKTLIRDVLRLDRNPPVYITASMEELLARAIWQNFIPVIDDRDVFIGIVTRQDIIRYFYTHSLHMEGEE